jgi:hypothetical protein
LSIWLWLVAAVVELGHLAAAAAAVIGLRRDFH